MLYRPWAGGHDCVYLAANSSWQDEDVEPPGLPDGLAWHLFADTGCEPPGDIAEPGREPLLTDPSRLRVAARSVVVLTARRPAADDPQGSEET